MSKDGGQRRWAMAAGKFDLLRHRHHFITHDPNTALGAMLLERGHPLVDHVEQGDLLTLRAEAWRDRAVKKIDRFNDELYFGWHDTSTQSSGDC